MEIDGRYVIIIAFLVMFALAMSSYCYYQMFLTGVEAVPIEVTASGFINANDPPFTDIEMAIVEAIKIESCEEKGEHAVLTSTPEPTADLLPVGSKKGPLIAQSCVAY